MVGFVWSSDPESYNDGSIATGRVSYAGQVKGVDPDEMGYPGPPGWGLGMRLTTSPHKKAQRCLGWDRHMEGDLAIRKRT
jgi:hypothetical protein